MSEVFLSEEPEEQLEITTFSPLALCSFLLSIIGLFSIQYFQMLPIAILAAILGAIGLLIAKRFKYGMFSRALAFLGVAIGTITSSYGPLYQSIESNYDLAQIRAISETYLENLSKDNLDNVFYLVGFPTEVDPSVSADSPTQKAMQRLREDRAHIEIRGRKTTPKWTFVSLVTEYPNQAGHTYKVIYRDDGQSVPPEYYLFVRKNCAKFDRSRTTVNWYVDKLESAKKQ